VTDEEALDLGRRFAACKGFRPMRGMLDNHGRTWTPDLLWRWTPKVDIPDLRDPATLGCLLALVREAHGQTTLSPVSGGKRRWFLADYGTTALQGESEAELLVAALEAAP